MVRVKGPDFTSIAYLRVRLYGQVDRAPGLFYRSTLFFHIMYVPLSPLLTYIVVEGSQDGDSFRGKRIPPYSRSVPAWSHVPMLAGPLQGGYA